MTVGKVIKLYGTEYRCIIRANGEEGTPGEGVKGWWFVSLATSKVRWVSDEELEQ